MRASNTAFLIVMVLVVGSLFYALSFAFYPRVDSGAITSSMSIRMSIIGSGTKPPPPHSSAVSEQKRTKQLLVLMKSAAENVEMRYPSHLSLFQLTYLFVIRDMFRAEFSFSSSPVQLWFVVDSNKHQHTVRGQQLQAENRLFHDLFLFSPGHPHNLSLLTEHAQVY